MCRISFFCSQRRASTTSSSRWRSLPASSRAAEQPNAVAPLQFLGFEHVQLIIPDGKERRAREFYVDVLGFTEIVRPESLGGRGGGWFRNGAVHLHLGSERDFHPTEKGHPAWLVPDLAALVARCESAGHSIEIAVPLPGFDRVHVYDPFGNRLELMERQ